MIIPKLSAGREAFDMSSPYIVIYPPIWLIAAYELVLYPYSTVLLLVWQLNRKAPSKNACLALSFVQVHNMKSAILHTQLLSFSQIFFWPFIMWILNPDLSWSKYDLLRNWAKFGIGISWNHVVINDIYFSMKLMNIFRTEQKI